MKSRSHYHGAQALPLNLNIVVCLHCGKPSKIGHYPTGRRRKCSPTRRFTNLSNGATGQRSTATGKIMKRTPGHDGYQNQP